MNAEVKVISPGHLSKDNNGKTCATVTLVKDERIKMIIDPGMVSDLKSISNGLYEEGLIPEDIDIVGLTHSHIDHYKNLGLFPNANYFDFWGFWENDVLREDKAKISDNIEIIKTPGHSYDGITFLVRTEKGKIAICGDVFWKKDSPKKDKYAQNIKELEKSRKKVLDIADYIIPGHGDMFRVERD